MKKEPKLIDIKSILDERGQINFLENGQDIDFAINRIYYLSNVSHDKSRGYHAHKQLRQLMISLSGEVNIRLNDGLGNEYCFKLNSKNKGLIIPCGYWRELKFKTKETICLVLASDPYDPDDYIRDYNEFLEYKKSK